VVSNHDGPLRKGSWQIREYIGTQASARPVPHGMSRETRWNAVSSSLADNPARTFPIINAK